MRRICLLLAVLLPVVVRSEPRQTMGEYVASVRSRVVGKVKEALGADRRHDGVNGVVTLVGDAHFFLQNGDDGLKVLCTGRMPKPGDRVEVSGVPSLEGGRVVFVSRGWKATGRSEIPKARPTSVSDLVDPAVSGGVNWLRVSVKGRAIGLTEGGFAINVGNVPVNIMTEDVPSFIKDCDRTHPCVTVTGVAELMLDPSVLLGESGYVMGVKIDVGAAEDVVLHADLPYLAARRERRFEIAVAVVLGLLAVGLLVVVAVVFRQRRGLFRTRTIMAERKRMADDIHDTIEQHLVGAGMLLKMNRLKEAQDVLVRAKREIRDIVWGLKNDDMMRLTPADMLRKLAHEENTKGIYRVDTRLEGLPETMDAASMRDLSLIVRESIGNAVKHGGAKKIAISSDPLGGGGWLLRLSNDGAPFDPAKAPGAKEGHFGLEGMRQRARRLGATVAFERRKEGMVLILEKRI